MQTQHAALTAEMARVTALHHVDARLAEVGLKATE
jgi:hypothetical protein